MAAHLIAVAPTTQKPSYVKQMIMDSNTRRQFFFFFLIFIITREVVVATIAHIGKSMLNVEDDDDRF